MNRGDSCTVTATKYRRGKKHCQFPVWERDRGTSVPQENTPTESTVHNLNSPLSAHNACLRSTAIACKMDSILFFFFLWGCCVFAHHFIIPLSPHGTTFVWWGCYVYVWHKPTELAHFLLFCSRIYFCLMALSTVFPSINTPDNSPLSFAVLSVLFLPYWSFQLRISLWKSPSALI